MATTSRCKALFLPATLASRWAVFDVFIARQCLYCGFVQENYLVLLQTQEPAFAQHTVDVDGTEQTRIAGRRRGSKTAIASHLPVAWVCIAATA